MGKSALVRYTPRPLRVVEGKLSGNRTAVEVGDKGKLTETV